MASKLISLDRESLEGALAGRNILLLGGVIYAAFVVANLLIAANPELMRSMENNLLAIRGAMQVIGAIFLFLASYQARKALNLPIFGIVAGSIFSLAIPCLFLVMLISMCMRLDNYFKTWQAHLYQPGKWSPAEFLASEAGKNWTPVTIDPSYLPPPAPKTPPHHVTTESESTE